MLDLWLLAQASTSPPLEVLIPQEVRPLPGKLDQTLVFNSNSPELVTQPGVLLSTFPPSYSENPEAHLNFSLSGRFDLFDHHIAKLPGPGTLYLGLLLHNPGSTPVTVDVLAAASYLTQPEAPFIDLPTLVDNQSGQVFAGPGSRMTSDLLRGVRQPDWPDRLTLLPNTSQMLMVRPIPGYNGRSTLAQVRSSGPVYAASLALVADAPPSLADWENLVRTGRLVTPRDLAPTPLGAPGRMIYGRVAGVGQGSRWQVTLSDGPDLPWLTVPPLGQSLSYVLSTANNGTLGTGQVQSAPLLVRYPDTAYLAHGNYGISYNLDFTLSNPTDQVRTITLALQSPRKPQEDRAEGGLRFNDPPDRQVTFRGTVRIRYDDTANLPQTIYRHVVLRRGQKGEPLLQLELPPQSRRLIYVDYLYPPDATPPQVLTIQSIL